MDMNKGNIDPLHTHADRHEQRQDCPPSLLAHGHEGNIESPLTHTHGYEQATLTPTLTHGQEQRQHCPHS